MSETWNFNVDTHPMANEISGVSRHIAGTTAAVVAMQAAVVGAEQQASKRICQNVNRGFFTLMHSQISQKIVAAQSEVDSLLIQMAAQTKQLVAIKSKMEHDYRMISARYTKLFNSLNQALKMRIFEIDKHIVNFADKKMSVIANRPLNLTATAPFMQLESLTASQKILSSYIKNRSVKMLSFIHKFLTEAKKQKEISESIMENKKLEIESSKINIPTLICESVVDSANSKNVSVAIVQEVLSGVSKGEIKSEVFSQSADIEWEDEEAKDEIKGEFSKLNSASSSSDRIKKLTLELFEKNNFLVAGGIAE